MGMIFMNGAAAYDEGVTLEANPYRPGSKLWSVWQAGWLQCEAEHGIVRVWPTSADCPSMLYGHEPASRLSLSPG